ncbi:MAG TPA: hypothetical protein VGR08_13370, partial [Thermomicrobiales bacterium]|nr:hypothetical protein [Thermomicrobiales bacterium]
MSKRPDRSFRRTRSTDLGRTPRSRRSSTATTLLIIMLLGALLGALPGGSLASAQVLAQSQTEDASTIELESEIVPDQAAPGDDVAILTTVTIETEPTAPDAAEETVTWSVTFDVPEDLEIGRTDCTLAVGTSCEIETDEAVGSVIVSGLLDGEALGTDVLVELETQATVVDEVTRDTLEVESCATVERLAGTPVAISADATPVDGPCLGDEETAELAIETSTLADATPATPGPTVTQIIEPVSTDAPTEIATPEPVATPESTAVQIIEPEPTATPTPEPTATPTPEPTATPTPEPTAT